MGQFASFSFNWEKKRTCVMADASPNGGRGGGDGVFSGVESGGLGWWRGSSSHCRSINRAAITRKNTNRLGESVDYSHRKRQIDLRTKMKVLGGFFGFLGFGLWISGLLLKRRRSPATPSPPTSSISFTGC
ncbi:unnamed protein product [Linum tenue]|uniref:Uncharacterized protein n=1 Tax=Linum tenue TaxID=586396 RepID=A0AAV0IPW7_9ROSI|nr:unnamed protein product [Linum tenue]